MRARSSTPTGTDLQAWCTASVVDDGAIPTIAIDTPCGRVLATDGDAVVCYRPSNFQMFSDRMGDPWSHGAFLVVKDRVDGTGPARDVITIEMGEDSVFSRPFAEFAAKYPAIGILHLDIAPIARRRVVVEARRRLTEGSMRYSIAQCVLLASFGLARRIAPDAAQHRLEGLALGLARALRVVQSAEATTCSGMLARVLDVALGDWRPSMFPARPRVAAWRTPPSMCEQHADPVVRDDADRDATNILTTPSDLAVTIPVTHRTIITPHEIYTLGGDVQRSTRFSVAVSPATAGSASRAG